MWGNGFPVRLIILGFLAWGTLGQEATFENDRTLWAAAHEANHASPRSSYNMGILARQDGWPDLAVTFFVEAADRAHGRPEEAQMLRKIRAQLAYLEMFGYPACDSPQAQPYCS